MTELLNPSMARSRTLRLRGVSAFAPLLAAALLGSVSGCHGRQMRAGNAQRLDFNQDVQPILASRCFSCHGPDPEMRKGVAFGWICK